MPDGLYVGGKLKRDIVNYFGQILLVQGTVLTEEHLAYIQSHHVDIDPSIVEHSATQTNLASEEEKLISNMADEFSSIFHSIRENGKIPVDKIRVTMTPSIHQVSESVNLFEILSGIQAKDDYTYRHNIGVGVISTLIGRWLGMNGEDLSLLTLAATLHDVGKVKIEDDILNKPGKFTEDEYLQMKRHTIYGYELLSKEKDIPERVALVALQHHEREDGGGYPFGLTGGRLDYYSKIVGVADIFHAMTSKRIYKDAMPLFQVMKQMVEEGFGHLEPKICHLFVKRMMEMSVGSHAVTSDNRIATIIQIHDNDPIRPFVMVGDFFYDLRQYRDIQLIGLVD